jgi:hypothetical protein
MRANEVRRSRKRLGRARAALLVAAATRALLLGAAVALLPIAAVALLDWGIALPRTMRAYVAPAALLAGLAAFAAALWRSRSTLAIGQVALWLENRLPELRYALVTLADQRTAATPHAAALEASAGSAPLERAVARGVIRSLAAPLLVLAAAAAALALLPGHAVSRVVAPRPGDLLDGTAARTDGASPLAPLAATITPPAYAGTRPFGLDDPAQIAALTGSTVRLRGPAPAGAAGVAAMLGESLLVVTDGPGRWEVNFTMPRTAIALRLTAGERSRIVAIEPRPDSLPTVTLLAPRDDSLLHAPRGSIALQATAADDFGLTAAWFEYIISSGEREIYTFRSGVAGSVRPEGGRTATLISRLPLDSLALSPGDIVHIRAVAVDGNTVTGPGRGTSATRTLRVPRAHEYDTLTLDIPPFEGDTAALSQRMLIILAEALERRRPRLAREVVVRESRDIGRDQAALRRRVSEIIFARLDGEAGAEHAHSPDDGHDHSADERRGELPPDSILAAAEAAGAAAVAGEALDFAHDESPVVAINRPLLEAYNAMWEAGRWLSIGEPDDALPHMRAALAAIQRARQAERIYLRGRPPAAVVDVAAARLQGRRGDARGGGREPRRPLGAARARLAVRLDNAIRMASQPGGAIVDSLLLLRLESLDAHAAFAAALGRAITELRAGRDATPLLLRAREAIAGSPRAAPGFTAWEATP